MTLEIRVYKEIEETEAKVMWGMSWRQLAAATLMAVLSAGVWFIFWRMLKIPDVGQIVVFVVDLPIAVWGWARPRGLKPETWLVYVTRHWVGQRRYLIDGPVLRHATRTDHKAERNS